MIAKTPKIARRSFIVGTAAVGSGLALGLKIPFGASGRSRPGRLARDQRVGGHSTGRHGRDPRRAVRDGPGHDHRARADGGRGARVRLVEGDDGVSDARPERGQEARVGRFLDGRQPRDPDVRGVRAQGRRDGADDARPGGGQWLGRAGLRVQRRQQRDHAQALRAHDHLRQGRRGRGQADAAGGRAAQGPEGLEDHRQVGEAPGHDGRR